MTTFEDMYQSANAKVVNEIVFFVTRKEYV